MSKARYIDAAEAARLVRKALKREFGKSVKFYVRTSKYSGGASINVRWMDGPTEAEVNAVVSAYKGGGFDGMIDLAYSKYSWLMPDGTAEMARSSGSGYSGEYDYPKPHPDAELVNFGSDYIFGNRSYSYEFVSAIVDAVAERTGWDKPEIKRHKTWMAKSSPDVPSAYIEPDFNGTENESYRRVLQNTSAKDGVTEEALTAGLNEVFGIPFMPEEAAAELAEETAEAVADVTKPDEERADKFVWGEGDIEIDEPAPEPVADKILDKGNDKVISRKFSK